MKTLCIIIRILTALELHHELTLQLHDLIRQASVVKMFGNLKFYSVLVTAIQFLLHRHKSIQSHTSRHFTLIVCQSQPYGEWKHEVLNDGFEFRHCNNKNLPLRCTPLVFMFTKHNKLKTLRPNNVCDKQYLV